MNPSHKRNPGPGANHHAKPVVQAHAPKGEFKVLRLAPAYPGAPEQCVCRENDEAAQFWDEQLAREYCAWKNGKL